MISLSDTKVLKSPQLLFRFICKKDLIDSWRALVMIVINKSKTIEKQALPAFLSGFLKGD